MKKFSTTVILILISFSIHATHMIGGELIYECIDPINHKYKITFKFYRDCGTKDWHLPYDAENYIGVYDQAGVRIAGFPLGIILPQPFPISDTLAISPFDTCLFFPEDVCVEEALYTGIATLPPIPGGYTLMFQHCCRNKSITNIIDPLLNGISWTIDIPDSSIATCNSSPVFDYYPLKFFCVNETIDFNLSAIDADGDSLVYQMCSPKGMFVGVDARPLPPPSFQVFRMPYLSPYIVTQIHWEAAIHFKLMQERAS